MDQGNQNHGYERHQVFYFDDIFILVEDCLFKVPRAFFENGSELFRKMFTLPHAEEGTPDGISDANPLRLEGVQKDDFVAFLKAMFPRRFPTHNKLSVDEWVSVLKLSTMWDFENLRRVAIKYLSRQPIEPAFKVSLCLKYTIKKWLVPALNKLAQREHALGQHELELLGGDIALKLAEVRGCYPPWRGCHCPCRHGHIDRNHRNNCIVGHCPRRNDFDFRPTILAVFGTLPLH